LPWRHCACPRRFARAVLPARHGAGHVFEAFDKEATGNLARRRRNRSRLLEQPAR
jgi:hypothetical protein